MIGKEELLFLTIQTAPTAVSQANGTAVRLKDDEILPQRILANHDSPRLTSERPSLRPQLF